VTGVQTCALPIFGGEHGFNGAMLSGAEAARLAGRRLETKGKE
jgi:hypothetical protein